MRARYYEPATGRFVSEDPAKDSKNWFAYCVNNPVTGADESGLEGSSAAGCGQLLKWLKAGLAALFLYLTTVIVGPRVAKDVAELAAVAAAGVEGMTMLENFQAMGEMAESGSTVMAGIFGFCGNAVGAEFFMSIKGLARTFQVGCKLAGLLVFWSTIAVISVMMVNNGLELMDDPLGYAHGGG
jgi:hypothetical protein